MSLWSQIEIEDLPPPTEEYTTVKQVSSRLDEIERELNTLKEHHRMLKAFAVALAVIVMIICFCLAMGW